MLLGLCGAAVIIAGTWVFDRVMKREPHRRVKHVVFFAVMFLLLGAGSIFLVRRSWMWIVLAAESLLLLWACIGAAMQWPGFRDPPPQDEGDDTDATPQGGG